MYSQAIRGLSKGYLPISLLPPSKLNIISQEVKEALHVSNRDYFDLGVDIIKENCDFQFISIMQVWYQQFLMEDMK